MMMAFKAAGVVAAMLVAQVASAAATYSFEIRSSATSVSSFVYEAPALIQLANGTEMNIPIAQLTSCVYLNGACGSQSGKQGALFKVDASGFNIVGVYGQFGMLGGGFSPNTFATYGAHQDPNSVKLTITSSDVAAAPEPATWALMLIGFGAISQGMRRRRHSLRPF